MLLGMVGVGLLRILEPIVLIPPRPGLLPLELVQLDQQIVDVVQILNFVHFLESIDHSNAGDVEHMDDNFYNSPKEVDAGGSVVLLVEDVEMHISEVDDEQMDNVLFIRTQLADHLLLFCLTHTTLALAELQFTKKKIGKFLYFLDLGFDLDLDDD